MLSPLPRRKPIPTSIAATPSPQPSHSHDSSVSPVSPPPVLARPARRRHPSQHPLLSTHTPVPLGTALCRSILVPALTPLPLDITLCHSILYIRRIPFSRCYSAPASSPLVLALLADDDDLTNSHRFPTASANPIYWKDHDMTTKVRPTGDA
ncbi:hypothetical protein B0H10DRAFT_2213083 [Mycena sp. CBHHK59/15]|nr:hypothetical protein B0H10DRAFT_2213083 [Mycena sp. CBHHK59/15]